MAAADTSSQVTIETGGNWWPRRRSPGPAPDRAAARGRDRAKRVGPPTGRGRRRRAVASGGDSSAGGSLGRLGRQLGWRLRQVAPPAARRWRRLDDDPAVSQTATDTVDGTVSGVDQATGGTVGATGVGNTSKTRLPASPARIRRSAKLVDGTVEAVGGLLGGKR